MSIRLNLDRLLVERRLTLTELADRVGISLVNLSILKNNKARAIRFTTLDALCRALQCQPADLLEHVDEPTPPVAGEMPAPEAAGDAPA